MIERQPYLPRFTAGGEGNPLGARALYLGNTVYRIHAAPINRRPSVISCRLAASASPTKTWKTSTNRVSVGTRVVVLPGSSPVSASAQSRVAR